MAATSRHENEMKQKYAKMAVTEQDPAKKIQAQCLSRGAHGIKGIGRTFRIMDDDRSGQLDYNEFKNGLADYGIQLNDEQEYRDCFDSFDRDGSGTLDFNEFLRALRPKVNQFRQNLIRKAFNKLDKDKSGTLTISDLDGVFRHETHPKFRSGEMTKEEILENFLTTWEGDGGTKGDGTVTWDEFLDYYAGVSASIDSDAYFNLMMVQAWKI
eukprot:m.257635 g.257635  ORF g.257635 m.257635 type:complete len:212 (-) comp16191_c1_seq8:70-705(-)